MKKKAKEKKVGRVRAALLDWLGIPVDLTTTEFWNQWSGKTSDTGESVSVETAMTLSAVWACVRLISETMASIPLTLYRRTSNGSVLGTAHPLYNVLRSQPNADTTAVNFYEPLIGSLLLQGVAYVERLYIGERVVGMNFLYLGRLNRQKTNSGTYVYKYREADGSTRTIPASRVAKILGFTLDGMNGLSAIEYGVNVFGSALSAQRSANTTFKNGLMPTVYFKMDKFLKPQQREDFRKDFKENVAGALNAGTNPLLEGGMTVGEVGIKPSDAQLLESRGFSVEEVCRWFRVAPWLVGHSSQGQTKWGTGMEQELLGFLIFTLGPWMTRLEQAVLKDFLSPADRVSYYVEFERDEFLKGDSASRAAFLSTLCNNGIMTRDEARKKLNMPVRGGNADVLTVQSAMTPIDSIGQTTTPGAVAAQALARLIDSGFNNGGDSHVQQQE